MPIWRNMVKSGIDSVGLLFDTSCETLQQGNSMQRVLQRHTETDGQDRAYCSHSKAGHNGLKELKSPQWPPTERAIAAIPRAVANGTVGIQEALHEIAKKKDY